MDMAERPFSVNVPLRGRLLVDESMARHVSWRAGGSAARAYVPADLDDLSVFLNSIAPDEPLCFVGLGSNLLVRDGGFKGTVVLMHSTHGRVVLEADSVYAEASVAAPKVAKFAATHGLAGAEFLAGIPGTVGGALAMNAGCYGSETWEFVQSVTTVDRRGLVRERGRGDFNIGYRHCVPVTRVEEWFVAARFSFPKGDGEQARARIRDLLARRAASQPLGTPNAGSVFRNPPGDHAARLIEAAGLKGHAVGGAEVSRKHSNFIVNTGRATAADIETLIADVRATVLKKFGVELIPEVRMLGEVES
jgi:UDP-N-acetylmuramate dehydrogenase